MKQISGSMILNGTTFTSIQVDYDSYSQESDSIELGPLSYSAIKIYGVEEEDSNE